MRRLRILLEHNNMSSNRQFKILREYDNIFFQMVQFRILREHNNKSFEWSGLGSFENLIICPSNGEICDSEII
jgi:hypothetical protein